MLQAKDRARTSHHVGSSSAEVGWNRVEFGTLEGHLECPVDHITSF
jgi:hypothetical protein